MKRFNYRWEFGKSRGSIDVDTHSESVAKQVAVLLAQDRAKTTSAKLKVWLLDTTNFI